MGYLLNLPGLSWYCCKHNDFELVLITSQRAYRSSLSRSRPNSQQAPIAAASGLKGFLQKGAPINPIGTYILKGRADAQCYRLPAAISVCEAHRVQRQCLRQTAQACQSGLQPTKKRMCGMPASSSLALHKALCSSLVGAQTLQDF